MDRKKKVLIIYSELHECSSRLLGILRVRNRIFRLELYNYIIVQKTVLNNKSFHIRRKSSLLFMMEFIHYIKILTFCILYKKKIRFTLVEVWSMIRYVLDTCFQGLQKLKNMFRYEMF